MATVTVKRKRPAIDMTPMVDLGFLLVTFFMLTTQFLPPDLANVSIPHSMSDLELPEYDVTTILISKEGNVFLTLEGDADYRKELMKQMNDKYSLELQKDELESFSKISSIGLPVSSIKQFVNLSQQEQKNVKQPGIVCDSTQNELADWLIFSRIANPKLRFAIKADKATPYPIIKNVFNTLQDCNIDRFNLITDTE